MIGFTRQEQGFLLFLTVSFLIGTVVWLYRDRWIPLPELDQSLNRAVVMRRADSLHALSSTDIRTPVSINRASVDELQTLPGIGPAMAGRIVAFRIENGQFRKLEDLLKVKGIGPKTFEKLKSFVSL